MQVLITGMHRSGTSVIARLLAECGCYLGRPEDMMPAKPDNPEGFWEHVDAVDVNDGIIEASGVAWDTVVGGEIELLSQADRSAVGGRIHDFVTLMSSQETWAVKDPRLALTFPLWRPLLNDAVVVWCVRHPIEIGVSLKGRNGFPIDLGIALWEAYTIEAMKRIVGVPVVVASYDDLLRDPVAEITRVVAAIDKVGKASLRVPDETTVESIVKANLHRSKISPEREDEFFSNRQRRLWELSRTEDGWSGHSRVPDLSEPSKDEILRHRRLLQLENEPVLTPEAVIHEVFEKVELRSEDRTKFLDGKVVALHHRFDEVLAALESQFGKTFCRFGEIEHSSRERHADVLNRLAGLESRVGEIEHSSRERHADVLNRLAGLESRVGEIADDRSRLREALEDRRRELEAVQAELARYRTALDGYQSSVGGRLMQRWWNLRSRS